MKAHSSYWKSWTMSQQHIKITSKVGSMHPSFITSTFSSSWHPCLYQGTTAPSCQCRTSDLSLILPSPMLPVKSIWLLSLLNSRSNSAMQPRLFLFFAPGLIQALHLLSGSLQQGLWWFPDCSLPIPICPAHYCLPHLIHPGHSVSLLEGTWTLVQSITAGLGSAFLWTILAVTRNDLSP